MLWKFWQILKILGSNDWSGQVIYLMQFYSGYSNIWAEFNAVVMETNVSDCMPFPVANFWG